MAEQFRVDTADKGLGQGRDDSDDPLEAHARPRPEDDLCQNGLMRAQAQGTLSRRQGSRASERARPREWRGLEDQG